MLYEVEYTDLDTSDGLIIPLSHIGWASDNLTFIDHQTLKGVGGVSQSYSFSPLTGSKFPNSEEQNASFKFKKGASKGFVGAAVDMQLGKVSFSVNGRWFTAYKIDVHDVFAAISDGWLCVSMFVIAPSVMWVLKIGWLMWIYRSS